jgi:hypothetical protein
MPGQPLAPNRLSYQGIGMISACTDGYLPIVILLWGTGEDINMEQEGYTPLHHASLHGHVHVVKFLLDQGAKVDAAHPDGCTPLMWAAAAGYTLVVEALVRAGANYALQDQRGYNAFHHAVHGERLETLHCLCMLDSTKSGHLAVDSEHHNVLHWAAYKGSVPIVRYLVEIMRMPVNAVDTTQRTALHWAAREGRKQVVRYLLGRGAALSNNSEGKTPEQEARERFHLDALFVFTEFRKGQANWVSIEAAPLSSLDLLMARPAQALHMICATILVCIVYGVSTIVPIPLMIFAPSSYPSKMLLRKVTGPRDGIRSVPDDPLAELRNQARYMFGGTVNHYFRDLWNLAGLITIVCIQLYLVSGADVSSVFAMKPNLYYLIWGALLLCAAFLVVLKVRHPAHASLNTGPIKDWSFMSAEKIGSGNHCFYTGNKKSVRSEYVQEVNSVVHRFDHFNYYLDVAVGSGNHHIYLLTEICFLLFQIGLFSTLLAWSNNGASGTCEKKGESSLIWNILVHAIPCGVEKSNATWSSLLMGTHTETVGFWLFAVPLVLSLLLLRSIMTGLTHAGANVTELEMKTKKARGEGGKEVPVFDFKGGKMLRSVYSEGSVVKNLLVFFGLQKPYRNWDAMEELPRSLWLHLGGSTK